MTLCLRVRSGPSTGRGTRCRGHWAWDWGGPIIPAVPDLAHLWWLHCVPGFGAAWFHYGNLVLHPKKACANDWGGDCGGVRASGRAIAAADRYFVTGNKVSSERHDNNGPTMLKAIGADRP